MKKYYFQAGDDLVEILPVSKVDLKRLQNAAPIEGHPTYHCEGVFWPKPFDGLEIFSWEEYDAPSSERQCVADHGMHKDAPERRCVRKANDPPCGEPDKYGWSCCGKPEVCHG